MRLFSFFIHGHVVDSDHVPVQIELHVGQEKVRKFSYKWNIAHLGGEIGEMLREKWDSLPRDASFFFNIRNITRFYRQHCLQKAKKYKWEELNIKANLEVATTELQNEIYNINLQGKISKQKNLLEEYDMRRVRGAIVRSRVKWQK